MRNETGKVKKADSREHYRGSFQKRGGKREEDPYDKKRDRGLINRFSQKGLVLQQI